MIKHPLYYLIIFFLMVACSPGVEIDYSQFKSRTPDAFLVEYSENDMLKQAFLYHEKKIIKQIVYRENSVSTIDFKYGDNGLLDSAIISQKFFSRKLKFHYEDTLITSWEVWNDNQLKQWVHLKRDEKGRIVLMNRISILYGLREKYLFNWKDENLADYEYSRYSTFGKYSYVYEFKYDEYRNPYYSVFSHIGFNFVDFTPLSKNNWVEMNAYETDIDTENRIAFTNIFLYSGNYPFIRESKPEHLENGEKIHCVFEYIR